MLVSGTALLLACLAFFSYDLYTFRAGMVRNLSIEAEITGSNAVSALLFDDQRSAQKTLSALANSPSILSAAIYTPDGHLFAGYARDSAYQSLPLLPLPPGKSQVHSFEADRLPSEGGLPL